MKALPPVSMPPKMPLSRRHTPRPLARHRGYREYRACIRWDFGFRCAFCLTHELDLFKHGAEGMALTTVEHFQPRSVEPARENDYANCYYACSLCNWSRSNLPALESGRRLLDPMCDAWADHYVAAGDMLAPREGDRDGHYTHQAYDLDDPRKVAMRRDRRENIEYCLRILRGAPERRQALVQILRTPNSDPDHARKAVDILATLDLASENARRDLMSWMAVPSDHPHRCRCGHTHHHSLPDIISQELIDLSP